MLNFLKKKIKKIIDMRVIRDSNLFDESFYINSNPDILHGKYTPLKHYFLFGEKEGRKPNHLFDPKWYLENNSDIVISGVSPLLHYIKYGKDEGRQTYGEKKNKKIHISKATSKEYRLNIEKIDKGRIVGWVVNQKKPEDIFKTKVYIDGIEYVTFLNDKSRSDLKKHKLSAGKGGFEVLFPNGLFSKEIHKVRVVLPDNTAVDVAIENRKELLADEFSCRPQISSRGVSIIVPIYNAADDVEACIERLLKYTTTDSNLILIDDSSTDKRILKILLAIPSDRKNIKILYNKKNLGFTKTVNRGIEEAKGDDVILLNSDARVTPYWLEGLKEAVDSDPRVATVTAMSDRAGAFSAPKMGNENELPSSVSEEKYSLAFKRNSLKLYPTVPTGNGFCLYIRRETITDIGALDEKAFPRGYGEENDFCMRARLNGWRNIIDDSTYVFHDRSKSFGESKNELMKSGRNVIDSRYKDYSKAIKVFSTSSLIHTARFCAKKALYESILTSSILPRALYVVSTQTGGTPQTNRDLMGAVQESFETWILQCNSKELTLSKYRVGETVVVRRAILKEHVDPLTHSSSEYDRVVSNWLSEYKFELVHIRHIAWHSLSLPKLAKEFGSTVINSFHDFYTLCPTVKLLDNNHKYCNAECTNSSGECKIEIWEQDALPQLKGEWVYEWRKKFANALKHCDAYITTSQSAKDTISSIYSKLPDDKFHIIPHGRDFLFEQILSKVEDKREFDILVPGNISFAKGWDIIVGLLEEDRSKKLHFHIMGNSDEQIKHPRLTFHGSYKREEFGAVIKKIAPTVGAVFSIWDETWCHTLTELWSVGVPVIVLNYGTVSQRVRESGAGWVYDDGDIKKLYSEIVKDLTDKDSVTKAILATQEWQKSRGLLHTNSFMASSYMQVYYRYMASTLNRKQIFMKDVFPKVLKTKVAIVSRVGEGSLIPPSLNINRLGGKTVNSLDREYIYIKLTPRQLIIAVELEGLSLALIEEDSLSRDDWKILEPYIESKKFKYIDINSNVIDIENREFDIKVKERFEETTVDYMQGQIENLLSKDKKIKINLMFLGGNINPRSSSFIRLIYPLTDKYMSDKVDINILSEVDPVEDIPYCDIMIIQRSVVSDMGIADKLLEKIELMGAKLIIDIDDAFSAIPSKHPEYELLMSKDKVVRYLMSNADMVWFSTEYLKSIYSGVFKSSVVVPNGLDFRVWGNKYSTLGYEKERNSILTMVYMGTATHDKDFELILSALDRLDSKYKGQFSLDIIGAVKNIPKRDWLKKVTVPSGSYPDFVEWFVNNCRYDIGLSPLEDNSFNKAKTDIKFLDYLGLGTLPMLSNIKAYNYSSDIKKYAVLVDDNRWFEEIEKVLLDRTIISNRFEGSKEYLWRDRDVVNIAKMQFDSLLGLS